MDVTKANRLLVLTSGLLRCRVSAKNADGWSVRGSFELTIVCLSEVVSLNFSGDVKIIRLIFNESQD